MSDFHAKSIAQVFEEMNASEKGLSQSDAEALLKEHGKNQLPKSHDKRTGVLLFFRQFKNVLIIILVIAGIISVALGEYIDATVIFITVAINVLVGFVQEYKADRALERLRSMVKYKAMVLRDEKERNISSEDVVPGDILLLEPGDKIQADGRILSIEDEFKVREALLTGESEPVTKQTDAVQEDAVLGDRLSMVFRGTVVTSGRAQVLVTSTGDDTEVGEIASMVRTTKDDRTPLQEQLGTLSKIIAIIIMIITVSLFVLEILFYEGEETIFQLFETAVAIAVSAIPEGLVISLTMILAIGMNTILKRKALVRKLIAAETLGSVSVICADKTGTITEGDMRISRLIKADGTIVEELPDTDQWKKKDRDPDVYRMMRIGVLANDATIQENEDGDQRFTGDTTDIAFVRDAETLGMRKDECEQEYPRLDGIPFSSERKYIASVNRIDGESHVLIKGAAEQLLEQSSHIQIGDATKKLTEAMKKTILEKHEEMTTSGYRVIGLAYKTHDSDTVDQEDMSELIFVGMVALSDPIRSEVSEALKLTKQAGIRSMMITGDHVSTAKHIAKEIGLYEDGQDVFDGKELKDIDDKKLEEVVSRASIFARVDPADKIRIVKALQRNGEVVAMTGDGVNDAPAIKAADIGVAVGSGADVSKETADMVLLDDSFATIVSAVEQGRTIYQNVKKVVLYLLGGRSAVVLIFIGALFAGFPLPALPVQILWVNIVEDVFPNLALAFDKGDPENMSEPPRKKKDPIIDQKMKTMIILKSILVNVALFAIFASVWLTTKDIELTRTVVFVGFGIDALFFIFSIRSLKKMVWNIPVLTNPYFLPAILFAALMLVSAVHVPILQKLLSTVPLPPQYWGMMILFGFFNLVLIELAKWFFLVREKKQQLYY